MSKIKDILNNISSVSFGTWMRLALLIISMVNAGLNMAGVNTLIVIDNDKLSEVLSLILAVITAVVAYWKNNSFTGAAQEADRVLSEIKEEL